MATRPPKPLALLVLLTLPDTVRLLLERAPDLKLVESAPVTRMIRFLGRSDECHEAFALIERGAAAQRSASGS